MNDLLADYIKNSQNSTLSKQFNEKMGKRSKRAFYLRDTKMANKRMKKHSTSLGIREMKIKTTMTKHYKTANVKIEIPSNAGEDEENQNILLVRM